MKLVYGLLFASMAATADVSVIVHPSNASTIDASTIEKIYTGKVKAFPDGSKVTPIRLAEGNPISEEFNSKALNKSSSQLKAYWSKLIFTGKGTPPDEVNSDAEMLKLVAANPDHIGFVSSSAVTGDVKVVHSF
ncbi:ABC-type phosphate transport system, periplasmic component [Pseudoalteromonas luteoviolacea B = ATCC 29581]|nr:ABC-type phosphate transport system, periplasmic component [Pseudoalteromonas luteoviolacea B = ATCC 29581]